MPQVETIDRKSKSDSFWQPIWLAENAKGETVQGTEALALIVEYVAANHNDGKKQISFVRGSDWETDYVIEPRPGAKSVTPIGVKVARSLQKLLEASGYAISERTTACNNDKAVIVAAKATETVTKATN